MPEDENDQDTQSDGSDSTDTAASVTGDDTQNQLAQDQEGDSGRGDGVTTVDGGPADEAGSGSGQVDLSQVTAEQIIQALSSSPEAQAYVRGQFEEWATEQADAQGQEEAQKQLQTLLDEENYEELGKRFAGEYTQRRTRQVVGQEVLEAAFGTIYQKFFSRPEFQSMTDEEKAHLNVNNFKSDADYLSALTDFIADKQMATTVEEKAKAIADERLEALANQQAGNNNGALGTPNLATGTPGKHGDLKTGADMLAAGMQEVLSQAGYERVDED